MLGVQPFLGRFFDESEDRPPTGEQVVVRGVQRLRNDAPVRVVDTLTRPTS